MKNKLIVLILATVLFLTASCSLPAASPTPTAVYTQYQLEYRLLAKYPDIFWCDPDIYPVAREGQEQYNSLQQFPDIRGNATEFAAILEHLGLPDKTDYTDAEKLDIYRQHKQLTRAITITPGDNIYNYSLRTGENQGWHIEGTITPYGQIKELKKETSFNTCPICLIQGTLIDTTEGSLPVEELKPGMMVWTVDKSGKRIAAPIIKTSNTTVSPSFKVVKLTLNDGRSVTASSGHPTADRKPLGVYQVGNYLDNSFVISTEEITYNGDSTYDLLPDGGTGLYWANGIKLMTTLTQDLN